jgi:hypothetical protein
VTSASHISNVRAAAWRGARVASIALLVALFAACSRTHKPNDEIEFRHDPIQIHVKNENFLDMNIAVVASGVSRRLGQVTGNASGDFTISWSAVNGQLIVLTATPIGGRGTYTMPGVSVGDGQMIELHIGSVLRQSSVVVHEPL